MPASEDEKDRQAVVYAIKVDNAESEPRRSLDEIQAIRSQKENCPGGNQSNFLRGWWKVRISILHDRLRNDTFHNISLYKNLLKALVLIFFEHQVPVSIMAILSTLDFITDVLVAIEFARSEKWGAFAITITFVFVPAVFVASYEIKEFNTPMSRLLGFFFSLISVEYMKYDWMYAL